MTIVEGVGEHLRRLWRRISPGLVENILDFYVFSIFPWMPKMMVVSVFYFFLREVSVFF